MVELLARYTSRDYFDNYPHPLILAKPDMQGNVSASCSDYSNMIKLTGGTEEFLTLFISRHSDAFA
jgi:hypothetical protein